MTDLSPLERAARALVNRMRRPATNGDVYAAFGTLALGLLIAAAVVQ